MFHKICCHRDYLGFSHLRLVLGANEHRPFARLCRASSGNGGVSRTLRYGVEQRSLRQRNRPNVKVLYFPEAFAYFLQRLGKVKKKYKRLSPHFSQKWTKSKEF